MEDEKPETTADPAAPSDPAPAPAEFPADPAPAEEPL